MFRRVLLSGTVILLLLCRCAPFSSRPSTPTGRDNRPPRILQIRGLHFQYYRLEEAAALLGAEPITVSYGYYKAFEGKRGVTYFPESPAEISQFDLVVMNDTPFSPRPTAQLSEGQLQLLQGFVEGGGALLLIGGHNAFAGGGYGESALAEALPVDVRERFDVEWLRPPAALRPAEGCFEGITWRNAPVVVWLHRLKGVKPGAKVLARAGSAPGIVVWQWKRGRVGVLAATCYGIPPEGQVAFWDWHEWPRVLAGTIRWLTEGGD